MVVALLLCILVVLITLRINTTPKQEAIVETIVSSGELVTSIAVEEKPEALAVVNDGNTISFNRDEDIHIYVAFTKHFIDTYKYEDSRNFCFALNVKQNGKGGYYDTYRNEN